MVEGLGLMCNAMTVIGGAGLTQLSESGQRSRTFLCVLMCTFGLPGVHNFVTIRMFLSPSVSNTIAIYFRHHHFLNWRIDMIYYELVKLFKVRE